MSPKKPVNYMPPDDPTAVYPIGSLRMEDDDSDERGPITDPERLPSITRPAAPSGPNPWLAASAILVTMLVMTLIFAALSGLAVLFF